MRFRPEQHLRRQREIRTVRETGQRVDCRAFTLWWLPRAGNAEERAAAGPMNKPSDRTRVCVVASTNAVGIAVQRNRAKRRLREVFRQQQHHVPPGCDLMMIARAAAGTVPLAELQRRFVEGCAQMAAKTKVSGA